jgi:hypothetical protein
MSRISEQRGGMNVCLLVEEEARQRRETLTEGEGMGEVRGHQPP